MQRFAIQADEEREGVATLLDAEADRWSIGGSILGFYTAGFDDLRALLRTLGQMDQSAAMQCDHDGL